MKIREWAAANDARLEAVRWDDPVGLSDALLAITPDGTTLVVLAFDIDRRVSCTPEIPPAPPFYPGVPASVPPPRTLDELCDAYDGIVAEHPRT